MTSSTRIVCCLVAGCLWLPVLGPVLAPGLAAANTFLVTTGGHGADPVPIRSKTLEMQSEHIVFKLNREEDAWDVVCDFTFRNVAKRSTRVEMGFPFPAAHTEQVGVFPPGAKKEPKLGTPLVWGFRARVNGQSVQTRPARFKRAQIPAIKTEALDGKRYDLIDYKRGFTWRADVPPREPLRVRVHYRHGVRHDLVHVSGNPTFESEIRLRYVLRSGRLWRGGRIGRSRLVVMPGQAFKICGKATPPGVKLVGRHASARAVWDLRRFAPKHDLSLCIFLGKDYTADLVRKYVANSTVDMTPGKPIGAKQDEYERKYDLRKGVGQLARHLVRARHGYRFKYGPTQRFFEGRWWYKPNLGYREALLTRDDRDLLKLVARLSARRRGPLGTRGSKRR